MSLTVFLIILAAAALHAVWNAVVKGGGDTLLTTILVAGTAGVIALCALLFLPPVAPVAWWYLAASGVLEVIYYLLIATAYRLADMSRAYPLMRGTAPLLVAVVSSTVLGNHLSVAGWAGVALISAGILAMLVGGRGLGDTRGLRFALLNAVAIAAYTLVDGYGVRASGAPATYAMWIFVLTGTPLAGWALATRRAAIMSYARTNWRFGLIGGLGTLSSYGVVLWAMTQAPIAVVAALRETSILFGTLIALLVLKEKITAARIAAVVVICIGAAALRLA